MAALSNGFKHRHSKTDSSLESFLGPKNAKHFPARSVLFHSEAERLNFFGPLSPTKTRLLKLSRWAPAGQLLPLRTPRFMPSVFLTGFKGLVHPKNKKRILRHYLLASAQIGKSKSFRSFTAILLNSWSSRRHEMAPFVSRSLEMPNRLEKTLFTSWTCGRARAPTSDEVHAHCLQLCSYREDSGF